MRSLDLVRSTPHPALTMIAGAPGVGKTRTLQQFCAREGQDAIYHSVAAGEGKPTGVATPLLSAFREKANGMSLFAMRETLAAFIGRGRVVILDEAQYLEPQGAEWTRALAEAGGFDLVLCGDLNLQKIMIRAPQLQSRMIRPVVIRHASRADVACMAEGTAFGTEQAIDLLYAIARLKGGLRNVENVTRLALLFAGHDQPGLEHLKAAIRDMKLAPAMEAEHG
ncbi:AAA family ATPase [Pseudoruegeria sp. HB172150]|uniref:AAA family ATPase n=1 Tax=Pseudoruegeria sp. HB172150 TaxID=2721164 RepID=UPI001C12F2B4|nr:AAA family ATPase [Pseudoruegeria sp. HB172150]